MVADEVHGGLSVPGGAPHDRSCVASGIEEQPDMVDLAVPEVEHRCSLDHHLLSGRGEPGRIDGTQVDASEAPSRIRARYWLGLSLCERKAKTSSRA